MYEAFYRLNESPFSLLPDPAFLYLSSKHKRALTTLQYGVTKIYGFTVITGEVGAGKTILIRQLLNELDDDVTVGLVSNTRQSFSELLKWVMVAFGLEYRGKDDVELNEDFVKFVINEYAADHRVVLIIDEAQNMSIDTLEALRMLSNINADKHQALQMIIVGQPELRATLQRPELQQFAQRVAVAYHLNALDQDEIKAYIQHRLTIAGGAPDLFDATAIKAIWHHSRGIPRLINTFCDTALVYGFAEEIDTLDVDIVNAVIKEREEAGVFIKSLTNDQVS